MFSIRVVSDLIEAQSIWNELSPKNNIYEDWDFRYIFYKYFNYPLRFYVGEEDSVIVGLLALQYNSDEKYLEFFGGSFMEDNHVFIKSGFERYIPEFYKKIKDEARLDDIIIDNELISMDFSDYKFIIDLKGLGSLDDYFKKTFSSKTRSKLRKKMRDIELLGPVVSENDFNDLDVLIELNKQTFGKESSFFRPFRSQIYHDILEGGFDIVMFSTEISEKKEGVSFGIKYGKTFVSLNSGVNKSNFKNLGTFMLLKRIERAINLNCEIFDASVGNLGWKELWHLDKISQYKFYYNKAFEDTD